MQDGGEYAWGKDVSAAATRHQTSPVWSAQCRKLPTRSQPYIDCFTEFMYMQCTHPYGTEALCRKRADTVGEPLS